MTDFPRYDSYKDSGVEWLGAVPKHWKILPFKALFQMSQEKNGKNVVGEMLSVSGYRGIEIKPYEYEEQKRSDDDLVDYRVVRPGQLVVNTMWLNYAGLGVSELDGHVSPAYRAYWMSEELHKRFAHYLLRSHVYVQGYTSQMQGIRPNSLQIKNVDFHRFPILIPEFKEQERIAQFLDCSTAEIDRAISQKQRLIELLQEQKAILINQAVTKGLNPNVPMRDSAIEWIGEIPEHWKVFPLTKYVKSIVDYRGKTPTKVESGVFLVTAKNIKDGLIDYEISKEYVAKKEYGQIMSRGFPAQNDLLFTTEAPLGGVALIDREDVALAQRIIKFRLKEECLDPEFTRYSMLSSHFQNYLLTEATGSTAQGMKASKLHKLRIAAPPIEEQLEIVNFISLHLAQSSEVIFQQQGIIENLTELRQVLIANAVTGKIKV